MTGEWRDGRKRERVDDWTGERKTEKGGCSVCVCDVDSSEVNVILQMLNAPAAKAMHESSLQK